MVQEVLAVVEVAVVVQLVQQTLQVALAALAQFLFTTKEKLNGNICSYARQLSVKHHCL